MSLVCANALTEDYAVIGVDLPTKKSLDKINKINSGIFPLESSDPKIHQFLSKHYRKKKIFMLLTMNMHTQKLMLLLLILI